ncbi:MAG: sigma-70 family RNA polymerase sigma factor [Bacteroidales bacterium]|nr:sigma-70 family RNA polymerase sigma factor [Bacteroidales bacterium]
MKNNTETIIDIEKLVKLYSKNIYNLAYRITGDRHDAEDAMQNTFLQIHQNLNKFRGESKLFTWIYRIALNESLKIKKKVVLDKKHFESVDADIEQFKNNIPSEIKQLQTDPEKEFIYKALMQEIKEGCHHFMLFRITEEQRIVFIFRILLGFTFKEISAILNISVNIIKSRFNRAKENLKRHVKDRCQWYNNKSSCTCEKCIGFALKMTPELVNIISEAANNSEYYKMAATSIKQNDDIETIFKKLPNLEYKTYPLKKL